MSDKGGFSEVFRCFGGFGKVREAGMNNSALFSCKSDFMVPSHDQKQKKE